MYFVYCINVFEIMIRITSYDLLLPSFGTGRDIYTLLLYEGGNDSVKIK